MGLHEHPRTRSPPPAGSRISLWPRGVRPAIEVTILGPNGQSHKQRAIVDNGADDSVLPYSLVVRLGFVDGTHDEVEYPHIA